MMDEFLVMEFSRRPEAEIVRGLLEARGIPCRLTSDDCGSKYPELEYARGVGLLVAQAHLQAVRGILAEVARGDLALEEGADVPGGFTVAEEY